MKVEIENKELKNIFIEIWNSQDAETRMALAEKIHYVTDKDVPAYLKTEQREGTFAYVIHLKNTDAIHLLPLLRTKNEAFIRYVIGHELGHIYYDHRDSELSEHEKELEADIYAVKNTKLISANLIENDSEWAEIIANKNYMTADELRRYINRDSFREELFIDQQAKNIKIISYLPLKELLDSRQKLLSVNIHLNVQKEKPLMGFVTRQGKQTLKDIEMIRKHLEENSTAIYGLFNASGQREIVDILKRYDDAFLNVEFKVTSDDLSGQTEKEFYRMALDMVIRELVEFAGVHMKDKNNG